MAININEAIAAIKRVGMHKVRVVPVTGQSPLDGKQQIEICENGVWSAVVTGVTSNMAQDILSQASNRVICG